MIMKKLIVNADDFGKTNGVNAGIIKAHEKGIVTSTSGIKLINWSNVLCID